MSLVCYSRLAVCSVVIPPAVTGGQALTFIFQNCRVETAETKPQALSSTAKEEKQGNLEDWGLKDSGKGEGVLRSESYYDSGDVMPRNCRAIVACEGVGRK